jgi:Leucine-rich repeat (LRR) protein
MEIYKTLRDLQILKDKLKLNYSLLELVNLQELYLGNHILTSLLKEIGQLTNLQQLWLGNNQLTSLPQEIKNIRGLRIYQ